MQAARAKQAAEAVEKQALDKEVPTFLEGGSCGTFDYLSGAFFVHRLPPFSLRTARSERK